MSFFQYRPVLLAVAASLLLAACGNLSQVNADGTTDEPVWPEVTHIAKYKELGTFPSQASLDSVGTGMTQDQLRHLLGAPHFSEGFFDVREWDYLFHFHTPGQGTNDVSSCQFKVLFAKEPYQQAYTQSFYWKAVDPIGADCPPN